MNACRDPKAGSGALARNPAPHSVQKRPPGGFLLPHAAQLTPSVVPQDPQNFASTGFAAPHVVHAGEVSMIDRCYDAPGGQVDLERNVYRVGSGWTFRSRLRAARWTCRRTRPGYLALA